jgi:peptidoglycan/LPS O-acetylase OafA/YrhL
MLRVYAGFWRRIKVENMKKEQSGRQSYVYELDLMRVVTALSVVAVHVFVFTTFLDSTVLSQQLQNGAVVAFHFTRAVFMFVTAFALVYVYHGKPFSLKRFWSKRGITTILPYVAWTVIYTWLNTQLWTTKPLNLNLVAFIHVIGSELLTGGASYQLYYILLTIQFYIVLPLFLFLIAKTARHPWIVLTISFLVQLALFTFSYTQLQEGPLASSGFWQVFRAHQDSMFFFYIFYFTLGGMTAIYYRQVSDFLLRHSRVVGCSFLLGLAILGFHFIYQVRIEGVSLGYATSVLQPVLIIYSLSAIVFLFWLASIWARRRKADGKPRGYRFWHVMSDASFGIYLMHPIFLGRALAWVQPILPVGTPVAVRELLVWLIAAGGATAASLLLMRIPVLSYLVGRGWIFPSPRKGAEVVPATVALAQPEAKITVSLSLPTPATESAPAALEMRQLEPAVTPPAEPQSKEKISL